MTQEALKLALEALEYYRSGEDYQPTPASEAIFSLRVALAQPEPEKVACDLSPMQEAAQMLRDRAAKQRKDNVND